MRATVARFSTQRTPLHASIPRSLHIPQNFYDLPELAPDAVLGTDANGDSVFPKQINDLALRHWEPNKSVQRIAHELSGGFE